MYNHYYNTHLRVSLLVFWTISMFQRSLSIYRFFREGECHDTVVVGSLLIVCILSAYCFNISICWLLSGGYIHICLLLRGG